MYTSETGPMFKDIFEMMEYFHKNMPSSLKLSICSSTAMTDSPQWVTELVAHEDDWKHSNQKTICLIEESDVSEAIKFLQQLNTRHEAN